MSRRSAKVGQNHSTIRRAAFGAFFLSGVAGLLHEVVWSKLLVALICTTAFADALRVGRIRPDSRPISRIPSTMQE